MTEPLTPDELAALREVAAQDAIFAWPGSETKEHGAPILRLLDEHAALRERHERALALIAVSEREGTPHDRGSCLRAIARILRGET